MRGWISAGNTGNVMAVRRQTPSGIHVVKGRGVLPGVPLAKLSFLLMDQRHRASWDSTCVSASCLETLDEDNDVIHQVIKTPAGVSNRDFVQARARLQVDETKFVLVLRSVVHASCPVKRGVVRGETHTSGWVCEELAVGEGNPPASQITFIASNDVKGNIPKSLAARGVGPAVLRWFQQLNQAGLSLDLETAPKDKS
jgi:hypothetical protein